MNGRDKLKELAAERGLSVKTAERYLHDAEAVEAHRLKIRSRRGVSKIFRRSLFDSSPIQPKNDLEAFADVIWRTHMKLVNLRTTRPELHGEISEILKITGPAIDRITEAYL
jgi:hypothetical protein